MGEDAPEPTFPISIERAVGKCRAWNTLGLLHSNPPAARGRGSLPEWAIPVSYRPLWIILSFMGTMAIMCVGTQPYDTGRRSGFLALERRSGRFHQNTAAALVARYEFLPKIHLRHDGRGRDWQNDR